MDRNESPRLRFKTVLRTVFVFCLFLCASASIAQSPVDFSGDWIRDPAKSDNFYKAFEVNYSITQTPQTFTVNQKLTHTVSNESVINDYSYTLDGKVSNTEKDHGTEKNTTKWSDDKTILTTRSTVTYGNEDVGFTETYSLSENGQVLTVVKSNIIPGGLSVKQVFNKKQ
jgi:hypothetical protein